MERSPTPTTFLANAAGWSFLDDEETSGVTGYVDGTEYTFSFFGHAEQPRRTGPRVRA